MVNYDFTVIMRKKICSSRQSIGASGRLVHAVMWKNGNNFSKRDNRVKKINLK